MLKHDRMPVKILEYESISNGILSSEKSTSQKVVHVQYDLHDRLHLYAGTADLQDTSISCYDKFVL